MESTFNNIVWNITTQNIQIFKDGQVHPLDTLSYQRLNIPLNYTLPLILYFEIFIPNQQLFEFRYDTPHMSPYYILGAISTFYNSDSYMNMLGPNVWFRGLVKYNDGYRIILDSIPYIQSVPMQGVGLKPIIRPVIDIQSPIIQSPDITTPDIQSPITLENLQERIQSAYPIDEPEQINGSVSNNPPSLYPRQIPHFNRLDIIMQIFHAYLDTSPMGSGKTYVTCALAKKYGLQIIVVAPLTILSKWAYVASLFGLTIGGIMTYQSMRGTKKYQPNNIYLRREGDNFYVTEAFEKIVRTGILLIFDEVHLVKNSTSQLEAAVTLCKYIADSNERRESNSRIALLSATPADKQQCATSLLRMLTIARHKSMYYYDRSNKQYIPLGFNEVYNWCRKINSSLAMQIRAGKLNKKTITTKLFEFLTQIIIRELASSMDTPEIEAEQDYKNGFYNMSESDTQNLNNAVGALRRALATWLRNQEIKLNYVVNESEINKILQGREGIAGITLSLQAIEKAKVQTMIRLAHHQLEIDPNCKVILYFNYHESIDDAMVMLKQYNPLRLDGTMKVKIRDRNVSLFEENNNNYRLLIGIVKVGSVGIDLDDKFGGHPRYMYIIPDYRFIDLYQATGRIYRITTRSKATIRFVYGRSAIVENTILDAIARKTITTKQYIVTANPAPFPGDFETYIEP